MPSRRAVLRALRKRIRVLLICLVFSAPLTGSSLPATDEVEQVRAFTRSLEFDYASWMLQTLFDKLGQFAMGAGRYLTAEKRDQVIDEYLDLTLQAQIEELRITQVYANPTVENPEVTSRIYEEKLAELQGRLAELEPFAEEILQNQVGAVAAEAGLTLGGQPVPPVLYHSTPLPLALIVSPRDEIRQLADLSLDPEMPVEERAELEAQVDRGLGVSSLVVQVGGVGVYPTMVQQTADLVWLSEVVAHEWVHNFLTLRPLGMSYLSSPELRTINETAASIAGKELGRALLESYYPQLVLQPSTSPPETVSQQTTATEAATEPVFDFDREMHVTRVEVDRLLAGGYVEEAEQYMEQRRIVFWEHGYTSLRKLNQAYFAFHGAYADEAGGGAAGEDPVGAAVRALRLNSPSLASFLNQISWMYSYEQLQSAVAAYEIAD